MSAFAMALDATFEDPNHGEDAIWRSGGTGPGLPVRILRLSPEAIIGMGDQRYDLEAMLISVRLSEVSAPTVGDQVDILDEMGEVVETVEVTSLARIDMRRLVRTCGVSPLAPDDPDDEP
jgi:hypothetical protein